MISNINVSLKHEMQTQEEKNKSMLSAKQEKIIYLDHKLKENTTILQTYISNTEKYKTLCECSKEKEKINELEIVKYKVEIDRLMNLVDE